MRPARETRPRYMIPVPPGRALLLMCLLLGGVVGCATLTPPAAVVVLLQEPDGSIGRIDVHTGQGTQTLSAAGQATTVATAGAPASAPVTLPAQEIADAFGPALVALPSPPVRFTLYFLSDSVELTPQSARLIPQIVAVIRDRRSVDTSVVGHTDTVASKAYNDPLARRRAEAVGTLLEAGGVAPGILEITSHGKDNPAVPTGDNVAELLNRRVEVTVR
jgi:outer membrane protein OmpA-like peptidoglycan-associated protein